jgi:hypothetical protein
MMRRRRKGRDLLNEADGWTDDAMSGFREPVGPYPSCFEFRFRSSTSTIGMEYR